MSSMNNWLGFSLSPQHHLPPQSNNPIHHHHHQDQDSVSRLTTFNSDEIPAGGAEVSGGCFADLTSHDSSLPSLNQLPATFGILEAFNRNPTQDWNMKDMRMNSFSCSTHIKLQQENEERPKLENFLGVGSHSFADHHHQANPITTNPSTNYHCNTGCENTNYNMYQETHEDTSQLTHNNNNSNSTIGLSMIKNWLRNNPAPPQTTEQKTAGGEELAVGTITAAPQSLSLSMSTGSQSSSPLPLLNGNAMESCTSDSSKLQQSAFDSGTTQTAMESTPRKSIDTFGQRTSIYRGVTRHRWTGRYEAHLWDNSCRREGQTRKGRQVYLGGYDKEEKAARAYDLAALKYWGTTTTTNFSITNYEKELEEMKKMTRQEYVASLRRKSSGFSRGASIYRGVTRHHQHGRWQARIGRVAGNKDLYLGTFSTQEEAAEAYDIAAIKFRGLNAVTNFEINRYDVKSILESTTLPIGGAAKRLKDAENAEMALEMHRAANEATAGSLNLHLTDGSPYNHIWPSIAFHQTAASHHHHPLSMFPYGRLWPCKQEQDSDNSFNDINHQLVGNGNGNGNTQNFLQPSVLHNLMSLESSAIDHGSGSNSCIYSGTGNNSNDFVYPMMGTVVVNQNGGGNGSFVGNDEGVFGSPADPYQIPARNLYYQSQPSNGIVKTAAGVYDQGSSCNTWIPTAVPTLGTSTFTVWNDT